MQSLQAFSWVDVSATTIKIFKYGECRTAYLPASLDWSSKAEALNFVQAGSIFDTLLHLEMHNPNFLHLPKW